MSSLNPESPRSGPGDSDSPAVTDAHQTGAASAQVDGLPEDLPPVQPPSAGFIFQLFVIPALIVASIIGVYTLFGKLGSGEQDWRKLVSELRNSNEHRRWRAALGLAQMLQGENGLPADERKLTNNPQVATALTELFQDVRQSKNVNSEQEIKHRAFLCTALGMLDQPETVLPPLRETMLDTNEAPAVRNAAVSSVALLIGRLQNDASSSDDSATVTDDEALLSDCIALARDKEPVLRELAAFVVGLFPGKTAENQLEVMLNDSHENVQANAAVGLARQGSTAGWPVFRSVLKDTAAGNNTAPANAGAETGRLLAVKNSLKAVGTLSDKWTAEQRTELNELIRPIADSHPEPRIRTDALAALQELQEN